MKAAATSTLPQDSTRILASEVRSILRVLEVEPPADDADALHTDTIGALLRLHHLSRVFRRLAAWMHVNERNSMMETMVAMRKDVLDWLLCALS